MEKLIVIVGITGTQGYSVAQTFLSLPGWRVRGTTRFLSSSKAQSLISQGAEMITADAADRTSLVLAFSDAHAIFGVTDFWSIFFDPATAQRASEEECTPGEIAFNIEVAHGINIAEAAARIETVERFVFSTLADVTKWSKEKYKVVYHFDSKAKTVDHIRRSLPDLAKKTSYLNVGEYMTNWKKTAALSQKKVRDGLFVLHRPHSGDAKIPMMWVERDTGKFVKALVDAEPGKTMLGYGSLIGWKDYIETWGYILGVEARFEQVSFNDYLSDLPASLAREVREGHLFQSEFGWDGGDPDVLHPRDLGVEGTHVEDYIRTENWTRLLDGQYPA